METQFYFKIQVTSYKLQWKYIKLHMYMNSWKRLRSSLLSKDYKY